MYTRYPNEDERKKLKKRVNSYKLHPIYALCLVGIFLVISSFLDQFPVLRLVISVVILIAMIYLLLRCALLRRCPRCSSWGTPITGGNCPRCGMHLDPSHKGPSVQDYPHSGVKSPFSSCLFFSSSIIKKDLRIRQCP